MWVWLGDRGSGLAEGLVWLAGFCTLVPPCLAERVAHRRCSLNICWGYMKGDRAEVPARRLPSAVMRVQANTGNVEIERRGGARDRKTFWNFVRAHRCRLAHTGLCAATGFSVASIGKPVPGEGVK